MKVFYKTMGCKVNAFETAAIEAMMKARGHETAQSLADADCFVLNSCAVTATAENHSLKAIRAARRANPGIITVLCGCVPQAFPDKYADTDYIDIIAGNRDRSALPGMIEHFSAFGVSTQPVAAHTPTEIYEDLEMTFQPGHTRAFLKVEDGCDRYCSYCVIPYARGRVRSLAPGRVAMRAKSLAENGYREIVLCGINLNKYGDGEGYGLAEGVRAAASPEGILRVRLGSLEPELMTDDLLQKLAEEPKLCPQFHLALQSGSTSTLKRMNRRYTAEEFLAAAERCRTYFPDAVFTTDVMVGFPGETAEEFMESLEFVRRFRFLKCHVFPYSARPGTRAASMPDQIGKNEKDRRAAAMASTAEGIRAEIIASFDGKPAEVILEQPEDGWFTGYTAHYIPCLLPPEAGAVGDVVRCVLEKQGDHCIGRMI